MRVRAIDENNDWLFGKGIQDLKQNTPAVMQNIKTRIQSFLNDCFFDVNAGIDWFNLLGNKNQLALNLAVSQTIYATPYVTGIVSFNLNLDHVSRNIMVNYTVNTSFGNQPVSSSTNFAFPTLGNLLTESGDILTTESGDRILT